MQAAIDHNKADYLFRLVAETTKRIEDATGNPCTFDTERNAVKSIDETGKETVMLVGLEHEPRYMIYTVDGTPFMYFDTPEELTETLEGILIQHHLTTL